MGVSIVTIFESSQCFPAAREKIENIKLFKSYFFKISVLWEEQQEW